MMWPPDECYPLKNQDKGTQLAVKVLRAPADESDLDGIAAFYGTLNRAATLEMLDRLAAAEATLSDHPLLGRAGRVAGTRELVVNGTPFIVVYVIEGDHLIVLRVWDARQQWPEH